MKIPSVAMVQAELTPEGTATEQALGWLRDVFQVVDDTTAARAGEILLSAKGRYNALEAQRKELTAPLLSVKAGIDDLFKPLTKALLTAETLLKSKLGAYHSAKEAERRAIMQASAAEYQAGGTPTAIIPQPAQVQGITVRQVWDYEITDPVLVPRALCTPDERLIRLCIADGDRSLPGIRIFQRDQVIARGAK
jgi:hypothetical protein